jgi:hypothetical protein
MRDGNKDKRESERRLLNKAGWVAVPALKSNGAFVWRWIIAGRKKAYTREQAVIIVSHRR